MQRLIRMMAGTALAALLPCAALAASAPDPVLGGWILNVAKSKFGSTPTPTSQLRTYTQTPDGLELIVKGESAEGESEVFESTFNYDGKDYAATGNPDYDTIAVRRINDYVTKSVLKRGGKVVGHLSRVESKDGTTLTVTEHLRNTKGMWVNEVLVYDKER
jgi:hypothetical protein